MPSLYGDEPDTTPEPQSEPAQTGEEKGGKTFLANAEDFPGCKPGDTYTVKAVRDHGEEIEFEVVGKEGEEGGEPGKEPMPEPAEPTQGGGLYA